MSGLTLKGLAEACRANGVPLASDPWEPAVLAKVRRAWRAKLEAVRTVGRNFVAALVAAIERWEREELEASLDSFLDLIVDVYAEGARA